MNYTFTDKKGKTRSIDVPEDYIITQCMALGITTPEALELYAYDQGYVSNDDAVQVKEEVRPRGKGKRTRKPNEVKRAVISSIYDYFCSGQVDDALSALNLSTLGTIDVINKERIISFTIEDDTYDLTLSKKRK